ncbi:MAG: hypothetical protein Kow0077_28600 [Anaerolineae bacterium]
MMFGWVIGLIVLIWLLNEGVGLFRGDDRRDSLDDALDLARRRYARGEISREEYYDLIDDLMASETASKAKRHFEG